MKIVIQNSVRDPSTRERRREHVAMVTPSPMIGGVHLAPRRSRSADTQQLSNHDLQVIADMIKCGVLRVFQASPYVELREDFFRPAAPPAVAPVEPEVKASEPESVEPVAAPEPEEPEVVAEPVAVAADDAARREELMSLKNAELRELLSNAGGGSGTGLSKAQLVDAILERST